MAYLVLIVEDEVKIRDLVRRYLEREGLGVLTTGSGAEAITIAATSPASVARTRFGALSAAAPRSAANRRAGYPPASVKITGRRAEPRGCPCR